MEKPRSDLALAAIATAAIPGMDVVSVRAPEQPGNQCDVAQVSDSDGNHWIIRAPRTDSAGADLAKERGILAALARLRDTGELSFNVPRPSGHAPLKEGGEAMIYPRIAGRCLQVETLGENLPIARALAQAIGELHEVDPAVFARAGLPVYDAGSFRARRMSEVEEASRTGHIPIPLLRRWRSALALDELWDFTTTPVHGDLAPEHVLVRGGIITGILDWSSAQVADPADDLAWLLASAPEEALEAIVDTYTQARAGNADARIVDRAVLASELELMRWLMYGVRARSNEIIDDAIAMLTQLDDAVRHEPEIGVHEPELGVDEPEEFSEIDPAQTEFLPLRLDETGRPIAPSADAVPDDDSATVELNLQREN